MVNLVILVGNLGQDPELRATAGGTPVASLSLATSANEKVGGEWKEVTEWHKVVVWGKTAEAVHKYNKKGSKLYIQGRNKTRKWTDKEGKDRYTTEVVADEVKFLGGGQREETHQNRRPDSEPEPAPDAEIPF